MPSAMNLCIDAISASVGRRLVELTVLMLMKRMSTLLGWCFAGTSSCRTALKRIDMKRDFFSVRTTIAAIYTPAGFALPKQTTGFELAKSCGRRRLRRRT
jgi:hypothetical protein